VRFTVLNVLNLVKIGYVSSVLGLSHSSLLYHLPQKILLVSKVVKKLLKNNHITLFFFNSESHSAKKCDRKQNLKKCKSN
jgi:hypothetical protein